MDGARIAAETADSARKGATPEAAYAAAAPHAHRRRFAQFFTPPPIASIMAEWAVRDSTRTLLDPSVGTGVLVRAASVRQPGLAVTACEKDAVVLGAFRQAVTASPGLTVVHGDFLTDDVGGGFDSLLMNPPYLRHHDFAYDPDVFARFSAEYGVEVSRLSNMYLLFTLKAVSLLAPGGRGAIIVPTEWMNANFGDAMKRFLVGGGHLREVLYFSNCSEIFDDALTTACVLLVERAGS